MEGREASVSPAQEPRYGWRLVHASLKVARWRASRRGAANANECDPRERGLATRARAKRRDEGKGYFPAQAPVAVPPPDPIGRLCVVPVRMVGLMLSTRDNVGRRRWCLLTEDVRSAGLLITSYLKVLIVIVERSDGMSMECLAYTEEPIRTRQLWRDGDGKSIKAGKAARPTERPGVTASASDGRWETAKSVNGMKPILGGGQPA